MVNRCLKLLLFVLACLAIQVQAKGVYLTQQAFLQSAFGETVPAVQTLWLKGETRAHLQTLFNRETIGLRQRYWLQQHRSAWLFNEVGKEMPITIGVVVEHGKILSVDVLEYRESRGGEIRHGFFTRQFQGAGLSEDMLGLSAGIDGITGATLSVRAMKRVAAAALFLHGQVVVPVETVNDPVHDLPATEGSR